MRATGAILGAFAALLAGAVPTLADGCGEAVCASVQDADAPGSAQVQAHVDTDPAEDRLVDEVRNLEDSSPAPLGGAPRVSDALEEAFKNVDAQASVLGSAHEGVGADATAHVVGQSLHEQYDSPDFPIGIARLLSSGESGADSTDPPADPSLNGAKPRSLAPAQIVRDVNPAAPAVLAATALIAGATGTGFLAAPGVRSALARALRGSGAGLLFTRLRQNEVLANATRTDILEFVRQNPGERIEVMRRALHVANGTLLYHLRVLHQHNQVRVLKQGHVARLYLAGPRVRPTPYVAPMRRRILSVVAADPGPTQRQIAHTLQLSERVVSYHVRALTSQGLIEVRRAGGAKNLYPPTATATRLPVAA